MNHFAGPKVGVRGLGSCGCMNRTIENLSDDCRKLISGENLCFRDNSSQSSRNVTCWQAGNSVPRTHYHHHHHHHLLPSTATITNQPVSYWSQPPPATSWDTAPCISIYTVLAPAEPPWHLHPEQISSVCRYLHTYLHIYISTQHAVCRTSGVCTTAATTSNASCFYKHTDVLLRTAGKLL